MRIGWSLCVLTACRIGFDDYPSMPDGATAQRYCLGDIGTATLCDDFEGPVIGTPWSRQTADNGGVIEIVDAPQRPGQHAMKHSFPDQASGIASARLELDIPGTSSYVSLYYDLMIEVRPSSGTIEIGDLVVIEPGIAAFYNDLMVRGGANDSYHEEYMPVIPGYQQGDRTAPLLSAGPWRRVEIAVDLATATMTCSIDGGIVYSGITRFAIGPGTVSIHSGLEYASGMLPGWTFYTDNTVIEVH